MDWRVSLFGGRTVIGESCFEVRLDWMHKYKQSLFTLSYCLSS
jgi:predicted component of viral defense system (DUF524 family)